MLNLRACHGAVALCAGCHFPSSDHRTSLVAGPFPLPITPLAVSAHLHTHSVRACVREHCYLPRRVRQRRTAIRSDQNSHHQPRSPPMAEISHVWVTRTFCRTRRADRAFCRRLPLGTGPREYSRHSSGFQLPSQLSGGLLGRIPSFMAWVEVVLLEMKGAHLRVSVQGKMLRHVPTDVDDPPLQQIWVRRKGMKAYPIAINILAAVWGTKRHTAVLRHPTTDGALTVDRRSKSNFSSKYHDRKENAWRGFWTPIRPSRGFCRWCNDYKVRKACSPASELLLDRAIPHAACPSSSSCITTTLSYFSLNKRESQRECLWKPTSSCSAPWLSIDSAMCRRKESRLSPSSCRTLQCDQNSDTRQCNRTWIEWGSDPAKPLSIWRLQPKQNGAEICI